MESSMKFFWALSIILAAMMCFSSVTVHAQEAEATTGAAEEETTAAPSLCTSGKPTADQWDQCTSAGTFKSKSFCYQNPTTMNFVYRYDFYKCVRSPAGPWLLYRQNCTGPVVVVDGEVFNRYNSATGRCDLQPPSS